MAPSVHGNLEYRSDLLKFYRIMEEIRDNIRPSHLEVMSKTPFWSLFKAFYDGNVIEAACKKSDIEIASILKFFNHQSKSFEFGSYQAMISAKDVAEIFGLPLTGLDINMNTRWKKCDSEFFKRHFNGVVRMNKVVLERKMTSVVQMVGSVNENDFVRLVALYFCATLFFCNTGHDLKWNIIQNVEDIERMSSYSWSTAVKNHLENSLMNMNGKPESVTGCVVAIPFWFCEQTRLIQPINGRDDMTPKFLRWNLLELYARMKIIDLHRLEISAMRSSNILVVAHPPSDEIDHRATQIVNQVPPRESSKIEHTPTNTMLISVPKEHINTPNNQKMKTSSSTFSHSGGCAQRNFIHTSHKLCARLSPYSNCGGPLQSNDTPATGKFLATPSPCSHIGGNAPKTSVKYSCQNDLAPTFDLMSFDENGNYHESPFNGQLHGTHSPSPKSILVNDMSHENPTQRCKLQVISDDVPLKYRKPLAPKGPSTNSPSSMIVRIKQKARKPLIRPDYVNIDDNQKMKKFKAMQAESSVPQMAAVNPQMSVALFRVGKCLSDTSARRLKSYIESTSEGTALWVGVHASVKRNEIMELLKGDPISLPIIDSFAEIMNATVLANKERETKSYCLPTFGWDLVREGNRDGKILVYLEKIVEYMQSCQVLFIPILHGDANQFSLLVMRKEDEKWEHYDPQTPLKRYGSNTVHSMSANKLHAHLSSHLKKTKRSVPYYLHRREFVKHRMSRDGNTLLEFKHPLSPEYRDALLWLQNEAKEFPCLSNSSCPQLAYNSLDSGVAVMYLIREIGKGCMLDGYIDPETMVHVRADALELFCKE